MNIQKCVKQSFSVIGKLGSTNDGDGFIQKLWKDAESNFNEVAELAKKDDNGHFVGFWGAMSDLSGSFMPWKDNFSKGLYLAGVEVENDTLPPQGWEKWTMPSSEYLTVKNEGTDIFEKMIEYMKNNNIKLVGAVYDFTNPQTGQGYMYFPIQRL
jgi:predicted transcriptional regulator YdeE